MAIRFLLDENLPPLYREQLLRLQPNWVVRMVGDRDVPEKGTLDPEILIWCEENEMVLVTNNRRSMPVHLADHLAQGRHVPGILTLRKRAEISRVVEDLILIGVAGAAEEFCDRIVYIPL